MYKWILFVLLIGAFSVGMIELFVQTSVHHDALEKAKTPVVKVDVPLNTEAAEAVFKQSCIACHGVNLVGGAGPNLQKVGSKMSDEDIVGLIQHGKGIMPAFKGTLKDDEIANLAKWLGTHK